ncbi:MAG: efflux RND transporter periplasmic adaptor subunit [Pseudomonadota bacterium]
MPPASDQAGPEASSDAPKDRKILYYRNPMGLPDTSPVPKKDPMGMDYLPVYEDAQPTKQSAPGAIQLTQEKLQRIGVRTERVQIRQIDTGIRASGTIRIDESRQYAIAPRFEGWVSKLHANQTGMRVRRGQPLLAVYSPQLAAVREEYRVADAAAARIGAHDPASAVSMRRLRDAALDRLRNWGIDDGQLRSIRRSDADLVLTSPADAVIIEKPVVEGARFEAGETVLRLADLSSVWLVADVPASSAPHVAIGQTAVFRSTTLPGRAYEGRVDFIQPTIDPDSRTIGVRIELKNSDGNLRPSLFGDVSITGDKGRPVIAIPHSAILDGGARKIVFVRVGEGRFEPRPVLVGTRGDTLVEVLEGLAEGEEIVVSANFLVDAESNLASALEGFGGHASHGPSAKAAGETSRNAARPQRDEPDASKPHDAHANESGREHEEH